MQPVSEQYSESPTCITPAHTRSERKRVQTGPAPSSPAPSGPTCGVAERALVLSLPVAALAHRRLAVLRQRGAVRPASQAHTEQQCTRAAGRSVEAARVHAAPAAPQRLARAQLRPERSASAHLAHRPEQLSSRAGCCGRLLPCALRQLAAERVDRVKVASVEGALRAPEQLQACGCRPAGGEGATSRWQGPERRRVPLAGPHAVRRRTVAFAAQAVHCAGSAPGPSHHLSHPAQSLGV